MRNHRLTSFGCALWLAATLVPHVASAQVPKYQQTPFTGLTGLRSLHTTTRQTAALGLVKFRNNPAVVNALVATLHQDPAVSVRQAAAAALSKMGQKAKQALSYAAVCDPSSAIRAGLTAYAKRAKIQCHTAPALPDSPSRIPRAEAQLLPYLGHPSPTTRLAAAKEVVRMRSPRGYQYVWNMMTKDPVGKVRASAIRMLTRAYTKKLVPVLHFVLTKDPDARVRMVAMEALAFLKERQAVPWLASSAKFEPVPRAQLVAVKALALIGDKNAATALATLCESHSNEDTRAAAVKALDSLKAHRRLAQPILARVLGQDRSGKVRAAAMRALATDHSAAACAARAERINDPDGDVRQAVVEQLAFCPARIARPALITAARDDRDPRVRGAAVAVLIKAGAAKSKDVLLPILASDKEASIREQVLRAVLTLPKRHQGAALADVARRDPEAKLRKLAVEALAKQPALVAVSALAAVLGQDRVTEIRAAAAMALSNFKDATAYQALQKAAADDPAEEVRRIAAKGAGKSPAQKAFVDALLPQTIDPSPAVRLKAVTQLCSLQVPRTYRALVRALWMDDNASIRTAVAKCFAEIDHPLVDIGLSVAHDTDTDGGTIRAVELSQKERVERLSALVGQLKTGDVPKRVEVLGLLQPTPNPQARQAAEGRLRDADLKVRRAAAITLARYMDRRAMQKLMQAGQKEPDAGLRQLVNRMYQRLSATWAAGKRPLNINTLINQLKVKDRRVAVWAARALGTLRDRRAFAPLKEAAKGDDPSLRHAAVVALATFGDVTIVSEAARSEEHKEVKEQLIQLNFLRKVEPEKVIAALRSTDVKEVQRGIEAAAIRQVNKAVPWLVRLALSHVSIGVRQAAVRTLVLYDLPLAQWAIRVAARHDASKALRRVMWQWAVYTDSGN